jgi:hypothetical protein
MACFALLRLLKKKIPTFGGCFLLFAALHRTPFVCSLAGFVSPAAAIKKPSIKLDYFIGGERDNASLFRRSSAQI